MAQQIYLRAVKDLVDARVGIEIVDQDEKWSQVVFSVVCVRMRKWSVLRVSRVMYICMINVCVYIYDIYMCM